MYFIDFLFIAIVLALNTYVFLKARGDLTVRFLKGLMLSLLCALFWGLFNMVGTEKIKSKTYSPSEYTVLKDNKKVIFSLDDKEIARTDHYIYKHAEDTSKVKLVYKEKLNRFGLTINSFTEVKTDK